MSIEMNRAMAQARSALGPITCAENTPMPTIELAIGSLFDEVSLLESAVCELFEKLGPVRCPEEHQPKPGISHEQTAPGSPIQASLREIYFRLEHQRQRLLDLYHSIDL